MTPARRGPLVCVRSTDVDALVGELHEEHIVTSSRDDRLRVALHLYNTAEDVDRVLGALRARRHLSPGRSADVAWPFGLGQT